MGPRAAGDLAPTCPKTRPHGPARRWDLPDVPPSPPSGPRPPLGPRPDVPPRPAPSAAPQAPALCAPARRWGLARRAPKAPRPLGPPAAGTSPDVPQDPRPLCARPPLGPPPTCPQGAPPSVRPARRWGPRPTCPQGAPPLCGDWARPRACPGSPPRPGSLGVKKIGAYLQRPSYEATHALRVSHPGSSGHTSVGGSSTWMVLPPCGCHSRWPSGIL